MKTIACALLLWATTFTGMTAEHSFAGTFVNDELTAELTSTADGYKGEFTMGGKTFPLTAQESQKSLRGKFKSDDGMFDFTASLEGATLTIKTDDTTYKLTRRSTNPLARKANPPVKPDKAPSVQEPTPLGAPAWKVFKHPTGLSMSYPPDWELRLLPPNGLQLLPPDPGTNTKGPSEAYVVLAESALGIQTAEDPRVLAYVEGQLLMLAPFFRRVGEVERIRAGAAPGILAIWEGTNPEGLKVQAQALCTILKGYGISVVALGEIKRVQAREKILRGIFASFAEGAGEKDPQLVGSWKFWTYRSNANGKLGTETTRFVTLQPDGTLFWKSSSESTGSITGKDSEGNEKFSAGWVGEGSNSDRGTWSAAEGRLYVRWNDGTLGEWSYRISGVPGNRRVYVESANQKKPDEWVEVGP